jgi:hypothetical protein
MKTLNKWVHVLEQQLVDVPPDIIHYRLSQIPVLRSMTVTMSFDTFDPFFRQSSLFSNSACREIWYHLSQLKSLARYVTNAEFLRHNAVCLTFVILLYSHDLEVSFRLYTSMLFDVLHLTDHTSI